MFCVLILDVEALNRPLPSRSEEAVLPQNPGQFLMFTS